MSSVFYRQPGQRYRVAASGDGMYLTDQDGRRYLDMSGGAAVSLFGHQHPVITARIESQLNTLAYAHTAFFTTAVQEELAARLADRFPTAGARVYFTGGGSEANETAIKMAWQYWRALGAPDKKIIISREHSYHGNTFLALSVSGNPLRRQASAAPLIDWPRIPPCYPYRYRAENESLFDYGQRVAGELAMTIERVGAANVAAFICEPVVGASLGAVAAVEGYLAAVRRICDEHEILLILDEVMCGSGRCGSYFAFEQDNVTPDIVTLGKGISGGYQPLAAVAVGARVGDVLSGHGFAHGFTYIGHATALAAGCAIQQLITETGVLDSVREKGARLLSVLGRRFADHPRVGEVRGRGLLAALELVSSRDSRAGFQAPLADTLRQACLDSGLICYPGQILTDDGFVPHILLAPPVMVEEEHIAVCCDTLEQVIHQVCDAGGA